MIECLLFTSDPGYGAAAIASGVAALVVDWEWQGKAVRQAGRGTEVNHGTVDDLVAMRHATDGRVVCRINNTPGRRGDECRLAIEHGANEIWLPMVRSPRELEQCLRAIDGRARLGTMIETREAMRLGREFAQLPLAHAYVGLNDYRIDNGHGGLFDPMVDGTIDRFRDEYPGALGVAGITHPDRGSPIPQRLLLADMVRLGCTFGVARRGFRADIDAGGIAGGIAAIDREVARLQARSSAEAASDRAALAAAVSRIRSAEAVPRLHAGIACAS
jgi:hypothetical protein